jgi:hypothetical protein
VHFMIRFTLPAAFAAMLIAPLSVQAGEVSHRTINQRQATQQRRIFNGVKNDQINRREYKNLQRRSQSVERQQQRDVRDGGSLTPHERNQLNQRLDNISNSIHRDRHK